MLPTKLLLDTQADLSLIHPALLEDVKKAPKSIKVKGVGGMQLVVDDVGELNGFFKVYALEKTKANVLIFAGVEDMYDITYERQ